MTKGMTPRVLSAVVVLAAIFFMGPRTGWAEEGEEERAVEARAEVLVRARHFELRDFNEETNENTIRQRVRAGVWLKWGKAGALVQIQDIRLWGEETSTLGDFSANIRVLSPRQCGLLQALRPAHRVSGRDRHLVPASTSAADRYRPPLRCAYRSNGQTFIPLMPSETSS